MKWVDVEFAFTRAVLHSFSKKGLLLTFPVLLLCGILAVFCKAVAHDASRWVSMSLAFLPILLSSGLLLGLGVLLIRLHLHEVKGLQLSFQRLVTGSLELIMGTTYLSIPPILAYLFLWVVLAFFFLLAEIPVIGSFFSVVFAFGPFLLIFGSLLLCLFNLGLLFFVAPVVAIQPFQRFTLAKRILSLFEGHILSQIVMFILALIPILFIAGLLSLSALLTNFSLAPERTIAVAVEWFFIMIPFAAILSPAVIFFFNFAAESHQLLRSKAYTQTT
jgi:hypothetical protein